MWKTLSGSLCGDLQAQYFKRNAAQALGSLEVGGIFSFYVSCKPELVELVER